MTEPTTLDAGATGATRVTGATGVTAADRPGTGPEQRWLWPIRIVTLVLTVVVLAAGATSVVGTFFIRHRTETTTFTGPVHQVEVSTDTGSIAVRAAAAGQPTTLISKGQSAFRQADHSAVIKDGVLMVSGTCRGNFVIADSCSMSFELAVPPGSAVQLNSDTGSITVFGLSGPSSSVLASTDTGNIRVVGVGGPVRLRTDTGDVTGDLLQGGTASAQTDTGDVTLGFTGSPHQVRAVADTGDVQVRVPDDGSAYQVQAGTSTGDRSVTVPTAVTSDRSIVAHSSTGNVRVLTQRIH